MAIVVKETATYIGTSSVVLPNNIVAGDLLLFFSGSYSSQPTVPSGWTDYDFQTTIANYQSYQRIFYKTAAADDAGKSWGGFSSNSSYGSHLLLVISGHDPVNTFHNKNYATGNTSLTISQTNITTSNVVGFLGLVNMANNSQPVPTYTVPSDFSQVVTRESANYWRGSVYKTNSTTSSNFPAITATTSSFGAFLGSIVFIKTGNEPPQVLTQSPSNYEPIGAVSSQTYLSWTYSDAESNTQYRYEISYREAGTTGAYTTVTSANGVTTTSHTFAANTFTDGKEYEWRLRLDDNQGSGWSPYYTAYFTAGTSKWIYGPQITSSSSTSVTTTRTFATYDFESGTQGWQNNPFFGTYADCTFTNSTTRPKTGTRSMEITWPTTSGQTRLASPSISGFNIGSIYRIEADVYVPAGSPIVRLDPFLQTGGKGGVILDKDSWVTAWCEFQAVNESITFAVVAEATTSGQKVFVDNFRVISPTPEPGNYQLSVRTSDGVGYGAWSAPSNTFAIRSGPVAEYLSLTPQRVGSNITVNWKYRDVDSQAQTKYKIRYRKK